MRVMTLADFTPSLRRPMKVKAANGTIDLLLVEAQAIPGSQRDGGGFRLEFHGPLQTGLVQGTYFFLVGGQPQEIFIVPLGPTGDKMRYEALFF